MHNTYLFSDVVDKEDLAQVARLAEWRATAMFSHGGGASLTSYITSAMRNAIHDEANRFHSVFTFRNHQSRGGLSGIRVVEAETVSLDDTRLHHYVNMDAMSQLELDIVHRWFNGKDAAAIAREHGVPLTTVYRTERRLKEKVEREVLHA